MDSVLYWKPVKLLEDGCDVIINILFIEGHFVLGQNKSTFHTLQS